ncbi:MAG TPA: C2 family cysteine protease [Casimicrobiaceae bacterium]|nr:C2 family cysteine protease [Casimicrobiaceae bacterium]
MKPWSVNPFALAELMEGAPPDGADAEALAGFLTKVYQVADLATLFDGSGGAPARLDLFRAVAEAVRDPQNLDDVLASHAAKQLIDLYGKDVVARVLPFIVPVANAVLDAQDPVGTYRVGAWRTVDQITVDGPSWRDPVQGAIADCYLVSAMIAIAWSLPAPWQARIAQTQARRSGAGVPFAFYRGASGVDWRAPVRTTIPVSTRGHPLYTRSSQREEAWPALLEKAFVVKLQGLESEPTPVDYRAIGAVGVEPQIAARMLAGGHARTRVNVTGSPADRLSAHVRKLTDERGVTRVPVMAWTFDGTHDTGGLGWRKTGLFHHHAYAVLGLYREDERDYVVLRNPYGNSLFRPDGCAVGPWTPGPGAHGDAVVTLNTNGVIAIGVQWFNRCMRKMGWLEPVSRGHA